MSRISAVLFDFDGTLQEGDKDELYARLNEISSRLKLGLTEEEVRQIGLSTPDYREMRAQMVLRGNELNPGRNLTEEEFQRINVEVSGTFDDRFYLSEGTIETLQFLRNGNYSVGLVTTRGGNSLPRLLERHGIVKYFGKAVVCRDNCKDRKPNPEPLHLGLSLLQASPSEAVYVGDSQRDDIGAA